MRPQPLKILIVDDEPVARRVLREQLEDFPEVRIVGEAANGKEALEKIAETKPDLVFLDLQMPVMGGFEVVRALREDPAPVIVIVTAFDEHAIKAFEAGAVDYLLKPVSASRLRMSVERAQRLRGQPVEIANEVAKISAAAPAAPVTTPARKVVGRNGDEYVLLDPDEVLAFQADGELVWIVTPRQRLLAAQTLRMIEERLGGRQFQRVSRNAVVNINHVRKMTALSSNRWLLTLSNSLQLVVSKRQAHKIRKLIRS